MRTLKALKYWLNGKWWQWMGFGVLLLLIGIAAAWWINHESWKTMLGEEGNQGGLIEPLHPLSIEYMRNQEYPSSEITIEQTLPSGSNYDRYIASYKSDGLKIYGLLTIPHGDPSTGSGPFVDPNRIGMWGHSMGGSLTLRSMVVSPDIKAGIIWAGVVASYQDMFENWRRSRPWQPSQREQAFRRPGRQELIDTYGDFATNPNFWQAIAPIYHVNGISGPVQIHHGTADDNVPLLFSERLKEALRSAGKEVEFFTYSGDDHNLSANLSLALEHSVAFFDRHLKK